MAEHLHGRSLYGASRRLWEDGYTRGRDKQQRLADILSHKLRLPHTGQRGLEVRNRITNKVNNEHFSLPETLDFLTWAAKANRPQSQLDTYIPSPISCARSRAILAHLFELSFSLSTAEALANTDLIRRRELDDLRNMAEFTKVLVFATARQTAGWYVYARISSFSFSARKALLAKAAATGVKFKLVYVPLGVAGGALGVVAGCLSFATGTIACVYSVGSAYALVQTGQIAWRDRFELGRQSLRDAAVFGIIATLNEQAEQIHETTRLQDLAEEEDV